MGDETPSNNEVAPPYMWSLIHLYRTIKKFVSKSTISFWPLAVISEASRTIIDSDYRTVKAKTLEVSCYLSSGKFCFTLLS